jgi:DNA-binding MarR family transcriptional regulator
MTRTRSGGTGRRDASTVNTCAVSARPCAAEPALDHISFAISRAYYNHLGILERVLAETGLARHVQPGMGYILFALYAEDDLAIKDLVERAGLSYSTLSGMVSRMKRAKLIACRRDAADGRLVRVRLTPLGKSLEPQCRAALERIDEIMRAGTSAKQLLATRHTLQQMTIAMRAYDNRRRGEKGAEPQQNGP